MAPAAKALAAWLLQLLAAAACWMRHCCQAHTAAAAPPAGQTPPHIVILLADDLGWNDLQGFGAGNRMQTPHIAELVAEGIRLDSFYTFKFCSPSRSQTLTGRFAYHLGQQTELNLNPQTGASAMWIYATSSQI